MLTHDQVRHIAKLARLALTDAEVENFTTQLSSILTYVEQLNEVDCAGVEPTSQVTKLQNVTRPDTMVDWCTREEMLSCTELPVVDDQIKVKPVL